MSNTHPRHGKAHGKAHSDDGNDDNDERLVDEILAGDDDGDDAGFGSDVSRGSDRPHGRIIRRRRAKRNDDSDSSFCSTLAVAAAVPASASLYPCMSCKGRFGIGDLYTLDMCSHRFCRACLRAEVASKVTGFCCMTLGCLSCGSALTQRDVMDLLSREEYDEYSRTLLEEAIAKSPSFIRCPNSACHFVVERVGTTPARLRHPVGAEAPKAVSGVPLTEEARRHYREYRFSCRECRTEFCSSCNAQPYHVGYTCETFRQFQTAQHCRYCNAALGSAEFLALEAEAASASGSGTAALSLVCSGAECQAKKKVACTRRLDCGHPCLGICDEVACLGCLQPGCTSAADQGYNKKRCDAR